MNPSDDATQQFLDSLPEILPDQRFRFGCHPGVACFNACCAELELMLTPYDALRLRRSLDMDSESFLKMHCRVGVFPDTGFPSLHLNMVRAPNSPCPFVSEAGCTVYPDRPGACRMYPIGRATRMARQDETPGAMYEQFFLVREPHCHGFSETTEWTVAEWTADQGLESYNRVNDRYSALMARQKALNKPIPIRQANMALLALYQPDRFQAFLRETKMFNRVPVPAEEQEAILHDEEACLDFACDWLEMVIFNDNARLSPR